MNDIETLVTVEDCSGTFGGLPQDQSLTRPAEVGLGEVMTGRSDENLLRSVRLVGEGGEGQERWQDNWPKVRQVG